MNDNKQDRKILDNFQLIAKTMIDGKSKKVMKSDYEEGFRLLGKNIFPDMEITFTELELKSVGVEFVSEWIVSNWQYLAENEKKSFWNELSKSFGTKPSCRRFFVVLSHAFLRVDKAQAIIPLSILFKQKAKGAKDFPLNREIISWVRSLFFNKKKVVITHLSLHPNVLEAKQIALYSIACAFVPTGKDKQNLHWQFAVIKWVCNSGLKFQMPDYLMQYVQDSILSQDNNKADVQSFLPGFPDTVEFGVKLRSTNDNQSALFENSEPERLGENQNQLLITSSTETKINKSKKIDHEDSRQNTIIKKKAITPLRALSALQQYVEESDKKSKDQSLELEKLSIENNNQKKQNLELLHANSDLEDRFDIFREKLAQSKIHSEELQARIDSLETRLAKFESKSQNLQVDKDTILEQLKSEKFHHQDELQRLAGRITITADEREKELLNRLGYSLRSEYGDLSHIRNMEMSVQNGEKLRSLLSRIFSNLQDAGIQF